MNFEEAFEIVEDCIKKNGVEIEYFALEIVNEHLAKMKEAPTDINGEPLECGDKVMICQQLDDTIYNFVGMKDKNIYVVSHENAVYPCKEIRKVKPEPVDPIEEVYERYRGLIDEYTGFPREATKYNTKYYDDMIGDLAHAIKTHMEAKEGNGGTIK
jgi:hypothetical protein